MLIESDDVVMSFDKPKETEKWSLVEATIDSGSAVSGLPKASIEDLSKIQEMQGGIQSYTSASEHSCKVLGVSCGQFASSKTGHTAKSRLRYWIR